MPNNFKKPGENNFRRKGPGGPRPASGRPVTPRPAGRSGGSRYGSRGGSRAGHASRSSRVTANSQPPDNTPIPEGLVYYCKSCEQIVDYKPTNFIFKYPIENCLKEKSKKDESTKAEMMCDIAYGTERSIKHYYKIKDEKFDAERREREDKAQRADKL